MAPNNISEITMVIPSYWARPTAIGHQQGDTIYDHPTPLDQEGTLRRTLESLNTLSFKQFQVCVLAVPTHYDIGDEVADKIKSIAASVNCPIKINVFSVSGEAKLHDYLKSKNRFDKFNLFRLKGYSPVRNMCLLAAHLMGSKIAIFIDDDEVFEDPEYLTKAIEYIGTLKDGRQISAIAGYYINPDGDYLLNRPVAPWMTYWNKIENMNKAFRQMIGSPPRIKKTPFVFGGNMVIHKKLWLEVPFDPGVPRGEDIDFLCNAGMFGYDFYLDNQLSIKHLPPPKSHSKWQQIREDMLRFIYMHKKINCQKDLPNMNRLSKSDFDPYPGAFIGDDLKDMIFKANTMLAEELLAEGDINGFKECQKNIMIGYDALNANLDPFQTLLDIKTGWSSIMESLDNEEARNELAECFI
jgi:glycosyltransferase involved in cell wall biosynthesis